MLLAMLRSRPARHNKRIRESNLLVNHPYLAELRMLKSERGLTGVRYVIYDPVKECYIIAFVSFNGEGSILAKHQGRVADPESLLAGFKDGIL